MLTVRAGAAQLPHAEARLVVLDLGSHLRGESDMVEARRVRSLALAAVGSVPLEVRRLAVLIRVLESTVDAVHVGWPVILVVRLTVGIGHGHDVGHLGAEARRLVYAVVAVVVDLAIGATGRPVALEVDVQRLAGVGRRCRRTSDAAKGQHHNAGCHQRFESQDSHTPLVVVSQSVDWRYVQ